tara:strand:+ start:17471 stop:17932 length:462 start_codon:yes stop_codon:yes gene_type:complete
MASKKIKKTMPFWQTKPLQEMSQQEWESLCDGCGLCCLQKLQDEDTDEIFFTRVSCQFLDCQSCRCKVYANRFEYLPECLNLTLDNLESTLPWLPSSCAYKLVYEGQALPEWHHLNSKNKNTIHSLNLSIKNKVVNELDVDEDDWQDYIIDLK